MRLLFTLFISFYCFSALAQGNINRVTIDHDTKKRGDVALIREAEEKAKQYSTLLNKTPPITTSYGNATQIKETIRNNERAIQYLQGEVASACAEAARLTKKAEVAYLHHCSHINEIKRAEKLNAQLRTKLSSLTVKEKQAQTIKEKEDFSDSELERKLSKMDEKSSGLDAELEILNRKLEADKKTTATQKEVRSIDDFLADADVTPKKKQNAGYDFLDNSTSGGSNDFLADTEEADSKLLGGTKAKIDTLDNNKQGVIDADGNTLIPYRNWEILSYKSGIAKVKERAEEYSSNCGANYYVLKVGFVDKLGDFLDKPQIEFETVEYMTYDAYPVLSIKAVPFLPKGETYEQRLARERREERARRERERKKEIAKKEKLRKQKECELKVNSWKRSMIAKYQ